MSIPSFSANIIVTLALTASALAQSAQEMSIEDLKREGTPSVNHIRTNATPREILVNQTRQGAWWDFSRYITPRLCAYHRSHPDCFRFIGSDKEVTIKGFTDFIAGDPFFKPKPPDPPSLFTVKDGRIIDP